MVVYVYFIETDWINKVYFCSLVCGDVEGRLTALFNRVQTIQKKTGQFDVSQPIWFWTVSVGTSMIETTLCSCCVLFILSQLLLCVGEFFGTTPEAEAEWQQYKTGAKKGSYP